MAEGLVVKEMEVKVRVGLEMKVEEKAAGGSEEKGRAAGLVEVEASVEESGGFKVLCWSGCAHLRLGMLEDGRLTRRALADVVRLASSELGLRCLGAELDVGLLTRVRREHEEGQA